MSFSSRWFKPLSAFVLLAFAAQANSGCLSHEHRISRDELQRVVQVAPERRGERVRVVQELGARRGQAVAPPITPAPDLEPWDNGGDDVYVDIWVSDGPRWRRPRGAPGVARTRGAPGVGPPRGAPGVVRAPPAGASPAPRPGGGAPTGVVPARVARSGSGGGGSSSGGGISLPSGGSGDGEALVVLAVVAIAVAALAAVGLAVTEGMRYDGDVAMWAGQPIHVRKASGEERVIPLHALTAADLADAKEAVVKDDEGYGLRTLGRAPLERRGLAFKVDLGTMDTSALEHSSLTGFASHIQLGYFPHDRVGLLGSASLGGGSYGSQFFARHSLAGEVQAFPLSLWRLHLGGFAGAGSMLFADDGARSSTGLALGGGALVELEATTRLAFTFRAGITAGRRGPGDWAQMRTFSFGLAVY